MWSLQLDPKACAFRYMRGWFIVDLLSVVPFELLLPSPKGLGINLSQLPRCLKLLRLPRLFRCDVRVMFPPSREFLPFHGLLDCSAHCNRRSV